MQIACVKTGDKYGPEYVTRLRDGVTRHMPHLFQFVCYTDEPVDGVYCEPLPADLPGWWAKVGLAKLERPLIYFDLDVIITGDLTPLMHWREFGIIEDWWVDGFNSSVMVFTGQEGDIWREFRPSMMDRLKGGDQQWFTMMRPDARTFPREWFVSAKSFACRDGVPEGARAVVFHGQPKPGDITTGWVPQMWRGVSEKAIL